jgi:hypothetical protein
MRRSITVLVAILSILALGTSVFAGPSRVAPHRYAPNSLDGRLARVDRVEGDRSLAAWAYRNGAEYDIAISRVDENGRWTEPAFVGIDDGRDQVQPALALDANGNAYVAYTDLAEGRVLLVVLRADRNSWSRPVALTRVGTGAESPALRVVENRLVVAFRIGDELQMIDLPLTDTDSLPSLLTIVDHPDPVEYTPDPIGETPCDRWEDGRWVIDDQDRPVNVTIPSRGTGETSGSTR